MARALTWAGGEHEFELRLEHLRALQDKCDAGPEWILARLSTKQWMVDDVIQPIRLGLEGAAYAFCFNRASNLDDGALRRPG